MRNGHGDAAAWMALGEFMAEVRAFMHRTHETLGGIMASVDELTAAFTALQSTVTDFISDVEAFIAAQAANIDPAALDSLKAGLDSMKDAIASADVSVEPPAPPTP